MPYLRRISVAKAYILPFVCYLLGTVFISRFGDQWYPLAYSLVAALVAGVIIGLLKGKKILRPHWRIQWGIAFGLIGIMLWIALAHLHLEQKLAGWLPSFLVPGEREAYNPFEELGYGIACWLFIAVRRRIPVLASAK